MRTEEETSEGTHYQEEATEGSAEPEVIEQGSEQEECMVAEEVEEQRQEHVREKNFRSNNEGGDRSSFINGLSVGLGIGCIATFVIMWIVVFFTPLLPSVTYENMLAIFIYPLIYLLAVGLVALTAGIVREYYSRKSSY